MDGTLTIDCVNYEKKQEQQNKRQKLDNYSNTKKTPHNRNRMIYTKEGTNKHIIEMVNSPEPADKKIFGSDD